MLFHDREDAGRRLAKLLAEYANHSDIIVLGLPRGGVPVAYAVAQELRVPLDVFLVRKLGTPGQEELALGAIASGGIQVLNRRIIDELGITDSTIREIVRREETELARREVAFRGDHAPLDLSEKTVILVDDGLATGSTMRAAARAIRQAGARKLVIAVPVGAQAVCELMRAEADEVVCAYMPDNFFAVGQSYVNFEQTTDEQVRELLKPTPQQT